MAFFDEIGKKVSEAGQKTIQKTKELSDTTRLNAMISDEEKKINNNYFQIGKLYVLNYKDNYEESFAGIISAINESELKISEYRKQIQNIKGVQHCVKCGAEVLRDAAFCSSCGAAMPKMQTMNTDNFIKCQNCGATVKKGMRFCTACGKPMEANPAVDADIENANETNTEEIQEKICKNCGAELEDDAVFCTECGTKL